MPADPGTEGFVTYTDPDVSTPFRVPPWNILKVRARPLEAGGSYLYLKGEPEPAVATQTEAELIARWLDAVEICNARNAPAEPPE